MTLNNCIKISIAALIFGMVFLSCRQEGFDSDPSVKLTFSVDSLLFDTVFTTVGSSTRSFKVYNTHNRRINISSIRLAGGNNSYFRINIDGSSASSLQNVEIEARDSIFIFVEVTVDPVKQNLPMIIVDSIIFNINNNVQDVKLAAWGQDAHFIYPNYEDPESGLRFHLIERDTAWSDNLPFVVYGLALVAPNTTLHMEEGLRLHFHNNASLIFLEGSTLKANGSIDRPIQIQGDRLESFYRDVPGQWGRIWFYATSKDHEINHAIIKNGTVGLHVDTIGSLTAPTLTIRNTIIKNMSIAGLLAQGSHVVAENMVIANCGEHAAILALGGTYDFRHCTFANFYSLQSRRTPSLVLNNYYEDIEGRIQVRDFTSINFSNCIIYGSLQEEIAFDFHPGTSPPFLFDHCLIRTEQETPSTFFPGLLKNQNPGFNNTQENDFRLLESSPAIGKGNPATANTVPVDILNRSRIERPDIGAYQYYEIPDDQ